MNPEPPAPIAHHPAFTVPPTEKPTDRAVRESEHCRFTLIGGFLGAGKTTAILRLAQQHVAAGRRVGIIANDLGEGLVDTQTYRAHDLPVEEMTGVCFACRFDDLLAAAGRLQDGHHPEVLLAEPAGSCTDIVSRVVEPLKTLYGDRFRVAPYVTLLDPHRALTALGSTGPTAFSAKITFLYKMQQNEADIVAINKADTLGPNEIHTLEQLVARNFPKAKLIVISARTGQGFDRLAALLDGGGPASANPLVTEPSDVEASAAGDARLAWLNATWRIIASSEFDPDALLLELARAIQARLADIPAEPAHVKMTLQSGPILAIANLLSSDRPPELSRPARSRLTTATLTINGRAEGQPSALRECVEAAVAAVIQPIARELTCRSIRETAPTLLSDTCRIEGAGDD